MRGSRERGEFGSRKRPPAMFKGLCTKSPRLIAVRGETKIPSRGGAGKGGG